VNWIAADILRIENGILVEHWDVLQDEATKARIQKRFADVWRPVHCLNQFFHPATALLIVASLKR
jgi:hypothetical protein